MTEVLSDDDLFSLAESVWQSILGLELERADQVDAKIGDPTVTSCVQITGDWEGAVTVAVSPALATKLAAAMFQMEIEDLGEEEVRDAMGEIANMTGGNVKGLAPGTNTLALPTVTTGDQDSLNIPKTKQINRVVAKTEGDTVVVTVLGRQA